MTQLVWIMVMFSYGMNINTGPEFSTQEKCEKAASQIAKNANSRISIGLIKEPWCVRIEK